MVFDNTDLFRLRQLQLVLDSTQLYWKAMSLMNYPLFILFCDRFFWGNNLQGALERGSIMFSVTFFMPRSNWSGQVKTNFSQEKLPFNFLWDLLSFKYLHLHEYLILLFFEKPNYTSVSFWYWFHTITCLINGQGLIKGQGLSFSKF